jgi:hypothetical protein
VVVLLSLSRKSKLHPSMQLKALKSDLKAWNEVEFGNIEKTKHLP